MMCFGQYRGSYTLPNFFINLNLKLMLYLHKASRITRHVDKPSRDNSEAGTRTLHGQLLKTRFDIMEPVVMC